MLWFKPKTKYIYRYEIPDMKCGMCELHIEDLVRKTVTVKKAVANRYKKLLTIYSNESLDTGYIKEEIEKTGYKVLNIEIEERQNA